MSFVRRLYSSRVARATAAGYYGQFIQLGYQLLSVPILTALWGLRGYGAWLLLVTIPSTLAVTDLGLNAAGGNAIAATVAAGEEVRAARIYASLRLACLAIGGVVTAAAGIFLIVLRPRTLAFAAAVTGGHAAATTALLLIYAFLVLQTTVSLAASRVNAYASAGTIYQTVVLAEFASTLIVAALGHGPLAVALWLVLVRAVGMLGLAIHVRARSPWMRAAPLRLDLAELRLLVPPSLAALVYTGASAVAVQGPVIVIGAMGGPASVPAFTTVRTASRLALQFAFRLSVASMPRYTALAARHERPRMNKLVLVNLVATAALVVPAAAVLPVVGPWLVRVWTHGVVNPSQMLVVWLVLAMVLDGAWMPIANFIMAINRHAGFAYFYLISALVSLPVGAMLEWRWQASGMAAALALQELAMVVWVVREGRRTAVLDRRGLAAAARASLHWLTARRAN